MSRNDDLLELIAMEMAYKRCVEHPGTESEMAGIESAGIAKDLLVQIALLGQKLELPRLTTTTSQIAAQEIHLWGLRQIHRDLTERNESLTQQLEAKIATQ